jgi:hypothetical protein
MSTQDGVTFAGDVTINSIELVAGGSKIDIREQVANIEFFEDIFSPFITGKVVMSDSQDLLNRMPLIGQELLQVDIETPELPGGKFKGTFYIHKLTERISMGDTKMGYVLHFINTDAVKDKNNSLNSAKKGYCSNIIQDIVAKDPKGLVSTKNLNMTPSMNGTRFVCNSWSPMRAIDFVTERAKNTHGIADYVFYENRDGYNFLGLSELYEQSPIQEFIDDNESVDGSDTDKSYKKVSKLFMHEGFNFFERLSSGMYINKLSNYDLMTKTYTSENYSGHEMFKSLPSLNKYPLATSDVIANADAASFNMHTHENMHKGFGDTSVEATLLQRTAQMATTKAFTVNIEVPGRWDYTVGKVINLTTFRKESTDKDTDMLDPMFSGNYLISAIGHTVTSKSHTCHMEIFKDSLIFDLTQLRDQ